MSPCIVYCQTHNNLVFTHRVTSNCGTKMMFIIIISNAVNIDVTERISTKQTVYTAYIQIKEKFVLYQLLIYIYIYIYISYIGIGTKSYGFRKISCLKNQPCNRFYPKKPAGMHW